MKRFLEIAEVTTSPLLDEIKAQKDSGGIIGGEQLEIKAQLFFTITSELSYFLINLIVAVGEEYSLNTLVDELRIPKTFIFFFTLTSSLKETTCELSL